MECKLFKPVPRIVFLINVWAADFNHAKSGALLKAILNNSHPLLYFTLPHEIFLHELKS